MKSEVKIMTDENRKILERINAYAENVLGEIDRSEERRVGKECAA